MRIVNTLGLALCSFIAVIAPSPVLSIDDPAARAIMEQVDARDDGNKQILDMEMVLIDKIGNKRIRRILSFRKDKEEETLKLMFFKYPADVKDTAFLTYDYTAADKDDEQWLYLPALHKTKRIASTQKSNSFMGSDLNYSDLTKPCIQDYDYFFHEKNKTSLIGDVKVWVIWRIPRSKKIIDETGYEKSLLFVRQDIYFVTRALHWEKEHGYLKYVDSKQLEVIDGIWVGVETHFTRKANNKLVHMTILKLDNIRFNQQMNNDLFTVRHMEKGIY